jgi:hypothetical protein
MGMEEMLWGERREKGTIVAANKPTEVSHIKAEWFEQIARRSR